ncbi:MAG: hypothetical protein ACOYZ7_13280 [Chloroflexota bacterium]
MLTRRVIFLLSGAALMLGLTFVLLSVLGAAVAPAALPALAASGVQADDLDLSLSGPQTTVANTVVTYSVYLTRPVGSDDWTLDYHLPQGFTVTATDPMTNSQPAGPPRLQWLPSRLAGYDIVTVAGYHLDREACDPVVHTAEIRDIYGDLEVLASDSMKTTVGGCLYLPATLRQSQ